MASLPKEQDVLTNVWGPHLNRMEGTRLDTGAEPDKIVPTHCCFCGQQCGIQLKVKDNEVIGYEPPIDPYARSCSGRSGVTVSSGAAGVEASSRRTWTTLFCFSIAAICARRTRRRR